MKNAADLHPKVVGGAFASLIALAVLQIAQARFPQYNITPTVAAEFTAAVGAAGAWLTDQSKWLGEVIDQKLRQHGLPPLPDNPPAA